uniref:Glucosylceramidase n=1 Tax=Panagrellus redivivus TaxID=6233 RepID=A0A7E4UQN8_PANRE
MSRWTVLFCVLLAVCASAAVKTCVQKVTPGLSQRIQCVCNATYCDEFPPLGTLGDDDVAVYKSSIDGKRFERTTVKFGSTAARSAKTITVTLDDTVRYQHIIGFGAAFTDATGYNLNKLPQAVRDVAMNAYFGEGGIGYSTGRVPIASTDFSLTKYSYDDVAGDFALKNWNLTNEDFQYKIPYIKQAQNLTNGEIKLFSTPWSAPGWMKTNNDMQGNGTIKGEVGGDYYQAFALYQYKFFEAYHNNGIDFWGLTVLNEPFSQGTWQIMTLSAQQEAAFLKNNLGPLLKNSSITKDIKIMIHDDQRDAIFNYSNTIISDPDAAKYVDGIAVHWYMDEQTSPTILTDVHNAHPDKFILPTEACTYAAKDMLGDWSRALQYSYDIITDLQNWATGWTDWNLVLDPQGGPNWVGNYVDAPLIINATTGEFYKQPIYYAMGHFSKFLQPLSQRVSLKIENYIATDYLEVVGFVTPDHHRVAILDNRQAAATYTINLVDAATNKTTSIDIEPRSIATIVWNSPSA